MKLDFDKLAAKLYHGLEEIGGAFIGALGSDLVIKGMSHGLGEVVKKTGESITPAHIQRLTLFLTGQIPREDEELINQSKDQLTNIDGRGNEVIAWNDFVASIKPAESREMYRLIIVGAPDPDLNKKDDDARRIANIKQTIIRVAGLSDGQFKKELQTMDLHGQTAKAKAQAGILARTFAPLKALFDRADKIIKDSGFTDGCKAVEATSKTIADLF
jgi:hypothetical protein